MSPSVELQEAEPQSVAAALFDHLIDERKHVCRNVETDRPGGLEIEDERIPDGQLHRQGALSHWPPRACPSHQARLRNPAAWRPERPNRRAGNFPPGKTACRTVPSRGRSAFIPG